MATNTENQGKHEVGQGFVARHQSEVIGVLHGWDRLRLQGTLRSMYYPVVMEQYLRKAGVLWKDFKSYAIGVTGRICQAAEELGKQYQRPVIYLASSQASKEDEARRSQERDGIKQGLIAVMSCVEPCRTWRMRGNPETKRLELRLEWGKCKHLYFYWEHQDLGFLHMRLQTWFPFFDPVLCERARMARAADGQRGDGLPARRQLFSMDRRCRAGTRVDGRAAQNRLAEGVRRVGQALSSGA